MSRRGIDYFENNRRAIYAQRAYTFANPHGWKDYGSEVWGRDRVRWPGRCGVRVCREVAAVPQLCGRVVRWAPMDTMTGRWRRLRSSVPSPSHPRSSFPRSASYIGATGSTSTRSMGSLTRSTASFDFDVPLVHGRCIPGFGWVASDYLGIDQGPIVAMIENGNSGLVWRVMRKNPHLRRGLRRAGFNGGWLTID